MGQVYTQLHPCTNTVIKHHTDTFYTEEEIPYYFIDSIPCNGKAVHDTIKGKIKYIDTGYHSIDTIVDNQQIKILESEIAFDNVKLGELTGQIIAKDKQIGDEHHRGNDWALRFWLLLLGIVIAIVLMIIKPKL